MQESHSPRAAPGMTHPPRRGVRPLRERCVRRGKHGFHHRPARDDLGHARCRDVHAEALVRVVERGRDPVLGLVVPSPFTGANLVVPLITLGTLRLLAEGRQLPRAAEATR